MSRAEVWAYTAAVVPKDCQFLELPDFTGVTANQDAVLKPEVVLTAQNRISKYCWGTYATKVGAGLNPNSADALKNSVIDQRRRDGTAVVIHGNPYASADANNLVPKKLGRTLVASIIMKEVIKRRLFVGHATDSYEWVQYQTIKTRVKAKDPEAIFGYQTCDWLVVDNIYLDEKGGDSLRVYGQEMLDTVFMERIDQNLPTILVFQFDINSYANRLPDIVGVGLSQIAQNQNTFKISLTNHK
jgi:hypothetical protein